MRIVDFHTHFFARPFFDALASQSTQPGTPDERLQRVVDRVGIELPHGDANAHLARWTAELDAKGIDRMVTFASAPEEIPAVGEAVAAADGRVVGMAVCNPLVEDAGERVRGLLSTGRFRGVLLFPAMHRYSPSDERCGPVYEAVAEAGGVVFVHCGLLVVKLRDLLGLPRGYDLRCADPLGVVPAADAHPGATFCIPHFGAGFLRETLLAGAQCQNIVTDTSSTNSWTRTQPGNPSLRDVFDRAFDVFGPGRVLFGTDSNTFPAGYRAERLEEQRRICDELGLTPEEQAQFFAGNAERIV